MLANTLLTFASLAWCAYAQRVPPSAPTAPIVDLGYAIYEGTFNQTTNTTNFLGVRYAAPPVGMRCQSSLYAIVYL